MSQPRPAAQPHAHHEEFSLPLFAFTVLVTLAGLFAILRFALPSLWAAQFLAPAWKAAAVFGSISMVTCLVEYFFHRYVLHQPAIPFLRYLYKQHTLHHALTHVARKQLPGGKGILYIENNFPMIEPEQGEASFFPWYSLAIFSACVAPLLFLLQWVAPSFPWFLAGLPTIAFSLTLYEVLHAINHWAIEKWAPLVESPTWGWFWKPVYGFHLRHHAVIDCNESISGFLGLPVGDWLFRTCIIPQTIYADGEPWSAEKFESPKPVWLIRKLDTWAETTVQRRRSIARGEIQPEAASDPSRVYSRGEEIANWVTHGLGLIASIGALVLLVRFASLRGNTWHIISFTVFGVSLITLYAVSTLYHAWKSTGTKKLFRKLDRAAIFLLIAGTYTPFLLTNLRGPWGWTLFGIIWGLSAVGIVVQLLYGNRFRYSSTLVYLIMGWLIVVAAKPLLAAVPHGSLWLLLAGGLCYTVGIIFYLWRKLKFHHAFWHSFVLGGSACHFLAVFLFLLPRAS